MEKNIAMTLVAWEERISFHAIILERIAGGVEGYVSDSVKFFRRHEIPQNV